jgi:hypothetical protein
LSQNGSSKGTIFLKKKPTALKKVSEGSFQIVPWLVLAIRSIRNGCLDTVAPPGL